MRSMRYLWAVALTEKLRLHNLLLPPGRTSMLKIWGRATSSNVQKVLWTCAELNIPFERVDIGGPFGGNRDPEYLRLNPNGLVPTVKDGDVVMWESNTICRYLATTHQGDRLYPSDPAQRTHVERWMDWQLAVPGGPMGALLYGLIRSTPETRDRTAIEAARRRAASAWTIVDDAVKDRPLPRRRSPDPRRDRHGNPDLSLVQLCDRTAGLAATSKPGSSGCASGPPSSNISKSQSHSREAAPHPLAHVCPASNVWRCDHWVRD